MHAVYVGMVPRLHKRNVYIQRKVRVWRAQKCIVIVRGKTTPTCAGLQRTPFQVGQYSADNGNMRKFRLQ